ncbi:MAG: hypothetical protein M1828_002756 [Chrysothrix sp. TS-e1954]|nr:MAG: hypothetical protein M1828_002756 [Chrysothrix sp. TS-e1954]
MSGVNGAQALWRETRTGEGKVYYWNTQTQETRWDKPEGVQIAPHEAPAGGQTSSAAQLWKETTAPDGRKYYYNTQTKETTWSMPDALKSTQQNNAQFRSNDPGFVAGGGNSFQRNHQPRESEERSMISSRPPERPPSFSHSEAPRQSFVTTASANEPDFATFAEAEAAFMKLLKRNGVQLDWTWEQTIKAVIRDPQYRSLKDPKERRTAFEKFQVEARAHDKEREKERVEKLREDFGKMLRSHPEIKHYTRWKTARPIIEGETIFRSTSDEAERRQLFEEHIVSIKKAFIESEALKRKLALEEMTSVLQNLDLSPDTRWPEAKAGIESNAQFKEDDKFRSLTNSDILTAYEKHIRSIEQTMNDSKQIDKLQKASHERRKRDAYVQLLKETQEQGKIRAGEKWMDFRPLIEDDPRYTAMLGQPGSTPIDLFWDIVEEEERALRSKQVEVLDAVDDKRFEITTETALEEFLSVVRTDRRTSSMSDYELTLIFQRLHERLVRQDEKERLKEERHQRHAIDALRSCIRHLHPAVESTHTWEEVRPRIEDFEEFQILKSDDLRRTAFDKVIRRLKEKEADIEHSERARRDRDRERENRRSGRHGRRSRSPEPDAYEADRRKAQADRERQYRKSALTPPVESRRRDRDHRYDNHASGRLNGHDHDRRERGLDRERSYMSRADPRDSSARELDYGESGRAGSSISGGTGRKRHGSEDDDGSRRGSKRLRGEADSRTRTPVDAAIAKEEEKEEVLRSGSEEGEIEEA